MIYMRRLKVLVTAIPRRDCRALEKNKPYLDSLAPLLFSTVKKVRVSSRETTEASSLGCRINVSAYTLLRKSLYVRSLLLFLRPHVVTR